MQITLELSPTIESVTFARQLGLTRCVSSQGIVRAGTPPRMDGDTAWRHIRQAYNGGYLRALLQAFQNAQRR
jgi:hypothetical protein